MINVESIFKSRDITLLTKIRLAKAMVFPLVIQMLELEHKERLSTKELMFLNCGAGEDS